MVVIPAIDIKAGRCVRLLQGDRRRQITYGRDPVVVAQHWIAAGAAWLHVIDLDGAFLGRPVHLGLLQRITALGVPVQAGGGFRTMADVEAGMAAGAARVILGTAAADLAAPAVQRHADRIAVSVDIREGRLISHGWTQVQARDAVELAQSLAAYGVRRFIYTDAGRDGMLVGPAADRVGQFVRAVGRPVIAAGGVGQPSDLRDLEAVGVEGVIVGRALYEGRIDRTVFQAGGM